jgi:hypothetical protein
MKQAGKTKQNKLYILIYKLGSKWIKYGNAANYAVQVVARKNATLSGILKQHHMATIIPANTDLNNFVWNGDKK